MCENVQYIKKETSLLAQSALFSDMVSAMDFMVDGFTHLAHSIYSI